jgi:L,D-transpeptidase catalytic domain
MSLLVPAAAMTRPAVVVADEKVESSGKLRVCCASHGTPEPEKIGKTESHGCIRLTNWDALDLAGMVHKGTVVRFVDRGSTATPLATE